MMVFSGNANPELAQKVASRLYLSLGKAQVGKFSDGEIAVELNENVRGKDVFVHASALERAGMRGLAEGQKISYEVEADRRTGKESATNLQKA